jgi:hypothetical protein
MHTYFLVKRRKINLHLNGIFAYNNLLITTGIQVFMTLGPTEADKIGDEQPAFLQG